MGTKEGYLTKQGAIVKVCLIVIVQHYVRHDIYDTIRYDTIR